MAMMIGFDDHQVRLGVDATNDCLAHLRWDSLNTDGTAQSRTHDQQNRLTRVGVSNLSYSANGGWT